MPQDRSDSLDVRPITRIMLRPIGSPLPLGFYAFGMGLLLISCLELHWIPLSDARNIPLVLLSFVAPLEFLACVLSFLARDTAAATAMGIFSLSWVAQGLVFIRQGQQPSTTLAIFLFLMAIILAALTVISYSAKPLLSIILAAAFVRSAAAGVVELGLKELAMTSAIIGLFLTCLSLYGGTAFLIEDLKRTDVLPVFRRGEADRAIHGRLDEQLQSVPNEPGVRQQL